MQQSHEIGLRIRQARENAGLTQEQLGSRVDMSPMGISHLEKGQRKMKIEDIIKIAERLNVRVAHLLEPITEKSIINLSNTANMSNFRSDFVLSDSEKKEAEDKINSAFSSLFNE